MGKINPAFIYEYYVSVSDTILEKSSDIFHVGFDWQACSLKSAESCEIGGSSSS